MKITKRHLRRLIKEISDEEALAEPDAMASWEDKLERHNPVDRSNVPQKYRRSEHELPWDHPDKRHGAMTPLKP